MQKLLREKSVAEVAEGFTRLLLEKVALIKFHSKLDKLKFGLISCRTNTEEMFIRDPFLRTPGSENANNDVAVFVLKDRKNTKKSLSLSSPAANPTKK